MSYYHDYEKRYRAAFEAGAVRWGHSPDDEWLSVTLAEWVDANELKGKLVVEFACGEGACGVILSNLGCRWIGFDAAPSAVEKARENIANFRNAQVYLADCVRGGDCMKEIQADAGLDVMGLHMLVADADRNAYLKNFSTMLKPSSPALFLRESYREDAFDGEVNSIDEWVKIHKLDLVTPEPRKIETPDGEATVMLPLLAARTRNLDGYRKDFKSAGLDILRFVPSEKNNTIIYSASFYTRKEA